MAGLFSPITLRNISLKNRIVLSPMAMYSANGDGQATDWHLVHYGARALGGVGLIMLETTAIDPLGRLSPNDLGLWDNDQTHPLARIVRLVHSTGAGIGIQLNHGGRKAWRDLSQIGHPLLAPSSIAYNADTPLPHELQISEIRDITAMWQAAAARANDAGFDIVEIHAAHGFLLHQFLSPLSNVRDDLYGGSLENRMRFLMEVGKAVRSVWPEQKPLFIRASITDRTEGGLSIPDWIAVANEIKGLGVDLIECSSGGLVENQVPGSGPGFNVSLSENIRKQAGIRCGAVGNITTPELADEIIQNNRADLIVLGRELLRNPNWPLRAACFLRESIDWPIQYRPAQT